MSDKRQRAIAKRLARKPSRERRKQRARAAYNREVRSRRNSLRNIDDGSDLMLPLAVALLTPRRRPR